MFVRNSSVAIQRERLVVGPPVQSRAELIEWSIPIHVEYDLENAGAASVQALIGFPLAACPLNDYLFAKHLAFLSGSASTCVKEPKMELTVDHKPVTGRWDFVFLREGIPFSNSQADSELIGKLRSLINLVVDPTERFYREDPKFLEAAKTLCDRLRGQMTESECDAFGSISVHRTFLWEHTFVPRKQISVIHDYTVNASWNLHPFDVFHADAFCLADPSVRSAWTKYREDLEQQEAAATKDVSIPYPYPREFFTEYVLQTGALWAGPIKDFELIIRKSSPQQLVSTCFSGLVRTSQVEFKAHRVNFKPVEDLRVLYLAPGELR